MQTETSSPAARRALARVPAFTIATVVVLLVAGLGADGTGELLGWMVSQAAAFVVTWTGTIWASLVHTALFLAETGGRLADLIGA